MKTVASKSVFGKLRSQTGLTDDGAALLDTALALGRSGTPIAVRRGSTVHMHSCFLANASNQLACGIAAHLKPLPKVGSRNGALV